MQQTYDNTKGAFWIDKLKDLFKDEKIDEEDDSWYQNSQSQENIDSDQNANLSEFDTGYLNEEDGQKSDISFLGNELQKGKEQNRMIYQKIADAFMNEDSLMADEVFIKEEATETIKKQIREEAFKEFGEEFNQTYFDQRNDPNLDIIEMDEFDRIKLYQDHTIFQKIFKRIWYIKTLINWIALKIISNPMFETISLGVILFNSILLSLDDPTTNTDNNADIDLALLIIYTIEMCLKIIALGFVFNQGAYLRDMWNIIDIVIIGTGYLPYIGLNNNEINLSALRSLRVLRPLKSVTKIKALKQLLQALFSAIPLLKDSIIILIFFFIIFGIAGLQLFTGQLKSRCVDSYYGIFEGDDGANVVVCASDPDCIDYQWKYEYPLICAKMMVSPDFDTVQFDTFGWSVLNVYVIVSLEGWTRIMNLMQAGFSFYTVFYFFFTVYLGAFFLMNLTMAIIGVKYTEAIMDQKEKRNQLQLINKVQGYNMKNLIEWGIYKSNKVYYQELEEEKKKKHSLFGFNLNLGIFAKSLKNLISQKQSSSGKLDEDQKQNSSGNLFSALKNLQLNNNSKELVPPIPELPLQSNLSSNPQQFKQSEQKNGIQENGKGKLFEASERSPKQELGQLEIDKSPSQPPLIPLEDMNKPIKKQNPQLGNLAGGAFGSSGRSLKNNKTKILSKKITKLDNNIMNKKIAPILLSPRNNNEDMKMSKRLSHSSNRNGSHISQNPTQNNYMQILERDEEGDLYSPDVLKSSQVSNQISTQKDRSNGSENHDNSQINGLIPPHILASQLEQINKSSEENGRHQGSRSRKSTGKYKPQTQTRIINSVSPDKNYKVLTVGQRQINLAPISSKQSKQQSEQKKQKSQQQQQQQQQSYTQLLKQENQQATKKIGTIMIQSKRFSKQGATQLGIDYQSPRNKIIEDENLLNIESINEEPIESPSSIPKNVRRTIIQSQTNIKNGNSIRRQSKKNNLFQNKMLESGHSSQNYTNTFVQQEGSMNLDKNDDWIENDDFLKEIEHKERVQKKLLRHDSSLGKEPQKEDFHIEQNYFSSSIPIYMLKQKKNNQQENQINVNGEPLYPIQIEQAKNYNGRDSSVKKLRSPIPRPSSNLRDASPNKADKTNGSNKVISNRRKIANGGNSNTNNSSSHHQSSKTKTFTITDQLSEESEMSIGNEHNNSQAPSKNQILPISPRDHSLNYIPNIPSNSHKHRQKDDTMLFNDMEFVQIFGKEERNPIKKVESKTVLPQQFRNRTMMKTLIKNENEDGSMPEFKRQESRRVATKYQAQIDEKLDIQKEEMKLLLNSKNLKARVLYEEPYDYSEDVQPNKKAKIKEFKRQEQQRKLRSLKFIINYYTKKRISKQQEKQNKNNKADKNKILPYSATYRGEAYKNEFLLDKILDNQIFDEAYSKKMSINNDLVNYNNTNNNNNNEFQSFQSPNYNNREDGVRGALSSNDLSNKNYQMEQPDGSINIQNGTQQNGNGMELSQDNIRSINDIPAAFQKKKTDRQNQLDASNSEINNNQQGPQSEKKIDFKPQVNGDTIPNAANIFLKMRSKKSSVGSEFRKQDSLANSLEELSISKQRHYFSQTKPRFQQNQEKQAKKKKGDDTLKWNQWDMQGAMAKIFLDIDESDPKKQVQKDDDDTVNATTVNAGKSIFSSSYMKHKDSRVSEGSESIGSKSNNDLGVEQSNNSVSKDESNAKAGDDKDKGNNSKVQSILNDAFEKQPIEQEYIKIRKKEIQNLEKRGLNSIEVDWSGDAVVPEKLYSRTTQKSLNNMIKSINHTKYDVEQNEGGIIGIIQAIRRRMKYFAHTSFFENSVMCCVIVNTILLTLDGIVTDQSGLDTISSLNYSFTIIFAVDMGLKLIGEGFSEYVSDKMNIFDAIIVCLSLFELIFLTGSGSSFSAFRAVRILRVFRVLRVTRLIRSLQFMKLMITAIGSAISQFIYILLLLFLFMFIYTLLGMSLFGGSFTMSDKPTRMNFDNFLNSAFAVLQLLTIENWNNLLQICIRSSVNNYLSVLYLISWMFIGNYVFMNLVLAIIMDSFDSAEVQEEKKDIENRFEVVEDLDLNHYSVGTTILGQTSQFGSSNYSNSMMNKSVHSSFSGTKKSQNDSLSLRSQTLKTDSQKEIEEENQKEDGENKDDKDKEKQTFEYFVGVDCNKSLYLFSKDNWFRKLCYRTYKHKLFEQVVLLAIILSSVKLTIDTYVSDQTSQFYIVGLSIDKFFTAFFTLEALIKVISLGFVVDDNSYLRDMWSQLDLFIVICSLIDVSVTSIDLSSIKILRLLRTLRPLRLLNHNKSMKLIVTALMESVGGITNMIIVVFLIWLMFAILALNLMKGKLNYCNFPDDSISYNLYEYRQEQCLNYPGAIWDTYNINCDNIGSSMLFLFILSSFEGWPDYVFTFIDADEVGPLQNSSAYFAFYFAIFIFIGGFFSINLFSAIMAFNFDIAQKKAKNKYLTDQQAQWIELQRMILNSTPDFNSMKKPQNKFRFMLWKFVRSQQVEVFIIFCILCNIVTMAMAYDTSPAYYDDRLNYLNLFFTAVFICECIIKIIAYGLGGYFFSGWNQFDFFVVCASIVDIIMAQMGKQVLSFLRAGPQLARVLRVLRVSRLLKLIKSFQNLQKLIQTTIFALPHLMNATALFMLFYFIFAILGCYLFSSVSSGRKIDQFNNFHNFHSAFIVLFRCSTGEDWMTIMFDVTKQTNGYSVIYFVLFIICQTYIMMNLFVLIIINQFEENYIDPDNPLQNFREQEESFKSLWVIMTEKENGIKIHERFLTDFYFELKEPLGYDYQAKKKNFIENLKLHNRGIKEEEIQIKCDKFKVKQKQEADKRIMQMNIFCDYDGYIFFNELFFFFFKFSLTEKISDFGNIKNQQQLEKQIKAIQILRKEENITLKKMNYLKKKQSQLMKQKVNKKRKEGVNPMVRRLFVGMSFSSWLQYSKNMQKKINDMNFNEEDISSESDTDSNNEDLHNQSDFLKNEEEEEIVQFRQNNNKKKIISREHTIFTRVKGPESNPSNLFEKEKYIFLPNTEIYRDDYLGEDENYYNQRVFSDAPSHKDSLFQNPDSKQQSSTQIPIKFLSQPNNQQVDTPINFKNKDNSPISLSQTNIHKESRFKNIIQQKKSIENDLENNLLSEESYPLQGNNPDLSGQNKSGDNNSDDQQKLKEGSLKSQNGISLQKLSSNIVSVEELDKINKGQNNIIPLQKIIINRNKDN